MTSAFEQFCQEQNIPYVIGPGHRHARAGWIQFDCPFCGPNTGKFHMGFNEAGIYVNCWRCGRHDLWNTLTALSSGVDLRSVIKAIRAQKGANLSHEDKAIDRALFRFPKHTGPLHRSHREYLSARQLNPKKTVKLWKVRGTGIASGKMSWRIVVPVYRYGQPVSWTARSIGDSEPRYLSAPAELEAIDHKKILFGEDYCRSVIIVTEGPFDAMRIGPGAVASLGTGISVEQLYRISRYPIRVICFDREKEAQKKANQIAKELAVMPGETYNVELDAKDPGEAPEEEIQDLRKEFLESGILA